VAAGRLRASSACEFLPKREDLMVDVAVLPYADIKKKRELAAKYVKFGAEVKNLKTVIPDLLKRVEELHEFNPMLGIAAAVWASSIPRSPRCRRAPSSRPSYRWPRRARQ
jgi:hypothetical protein